MAGIPDTISEGLGRYSIGEKLRSLRLRKSMGLVELGKHTSLSAALLSKLERGKLFPTLPTLLRIAMVFGVGLDYFFTDERKRRIVGVVRKDERVRFPERPGAQDVQYFFECLDYRATERKLSAFLADFQEAAAGKAQASPARRNRISLRVKGVARRSRSAAMNMYWRPKTPSISTPPSRTATAVAARSPAPA